MEKQLVTQPSAMPTRKITFGVPLGAFIGKVYGVLMESFLPTYTALYDNDAILAVAAISTGVIAYYVKDRANV